MWARVRLILTLPPGPPLVPRSPAGRPQNGINVLQAAAYATQAALNNPALQPILMAGANPWLSPSAIYQGLVNGGADNGNGVGGGQCASSMLDSAAALGAYGMPMGAQLGGPQHAGQGLVNGGVNAATLSLLQQQAHAAQQAAAAGQSCGTGDAGAAGGWGMDASSGAANSLLFYQNHGLTDHRCVCACACTCSASCAHAHLPGVCLGQAMQSQPCCQSALLYPMASRRKCACTPWPRAPTQATTTTTPPTTWQASGLIAVPPPPQQRGCCASPLLLLLLRHALLVPFFHRAAAPRAL